MIWIELVILLACIVIGARLGGIDLGALATMQAAGGLDYLVQLTQRIFRSIPQNVTFLAPLVTYVGAPSGKDDP